MARSATARELEKDRSMRDFSRTREPRVPSSHRRAGNSFVLQQHAARGLHYDVHLALHLDQTITAAMRRKAA